MMYIPSGKAPFTPFYSINTIYTIKQFFNRRRNISLNISVTHSEDFPLAWSAIMNIEREYTNKNKHGVMFECN